MELLPQSLKTIFFPLGGILLPGHSTTNEKTDWEQKRNSKLLTDVDSLKLFLC